MASLVMVEAQVVVSLHSVCLLWFRSSLDLHIAPVDSYEYHNYGSRSHSAAYGQYNYRCMCWLLMNNVIDPNRSFYSRYDCMSSSRVVHRIDRDQLSYMYPPSTMASRQDEFYEDPRGAPSDQMDAFEDNFVIDSQLSNEDQMMEEANEETSIPLDDVSASLFDENQEEKDDTKWLFDYSILSREFCLFGINNKAMTSIKDKED